MLKKKINKVINSKYFIPCFVIVINMMFVVICNVLFEPRYETVDDFTIMKIISKLDGTYNFYAIHIYPILSFIIMLLYKTTININWYTIVLLFIQFISFTTIGIIFLNKNKKIGTLCYIFIVSTIYSRLLLIINYTSVAAIAILAGTIAIMYYIDTNSKNTKIIGLFLIIIGAMLRLQSTIIVLPFLFLYVLYYTINNKNYKAIKILILIIIIIAIIYISNLAFYKINPIYNKYTEFNNIRTYLFDYNVLDYNQNKPIFDKVGWTYTDWKLFYTYSFSDENFYTFDNLYNLKANIDNDVSINKIIYSFKLLYLTTIQEGYLILFIGICAVTLIAVILNKNRFTIVSFLLLHIFINWILCYTKPMYRVIVPLYATTLTIMLYMILQKKDFKPIKSTKSSKYKNILLVYCTILYILINSVYIYKTSISYNKEYFSTIKEIIDYTNSNKENAYVYPNVLSNISLAYSIYEKIPDDTFSNLSHMGDWDIYNKEYYEFKERYDIENIITDLYKKDNLYIISGNVYAANNKVYTNHIDIIKEYIEKHYNVEINYKIVKEFSNSINIYKIYEK